MKGLLPSIIHSFIKISYKKISINAMSIPKLYSIKNIEKIYSTGEEPVEVLCSDLNSYICKYIKNATSPFKLTCELVGSIMAMAWKMPTPPIAFIEIKEEHWRNLQIKHKNINPALGSKRLEGVIDITPISDNIETSCDIIMQLVTISLFDFWIANEDRNANNANLMFDVNNKKFISLDYGCVLNTASFDSKLLQLTTTDTILSSELFHNLVSTRTKSHINKNINAIKQNYLDNLRTSEMQISFILEELPKTWNLTLEEVAEKLHQLFDKNWQQEVWDNFEENLKENLENE